MAIRALLGWLVILLFAILNGALRQALLIPRFGERPGYITSTSLLCIVIFGAAWVQLRWIRPAPAREAWLIGFADDGIVSETLVGGAARWYLLPRISVGPEVAYIDGDDHSHLIATGNVTFDLFAPTRGRPRQAAPFLVVGGGLFQTRESFLAETFTSSEGAFTAGGGVRALVGDRVTIGVDMRVGWELHLRLNGFIGLRLGR